MLSFKISDEGTAERRRRPLEPDPRNFICVRHWEERHFGMEFVSNSSPRTRVLRIGQAFLRTILSPIKSCPNLAHCGNTLPGLSRIPSHLFPSCCYLDIAQPLRHSCGCLLCSPWSTPASRRVGASCVVSGGSNAMRQSQLV